MSFDVDTNALATFATVLEKDRAAAAAALSYLDAHSKIEAVGALWADFYAATEQFVGTLRGALAHLESIFKVSQGEIAKVISLYQHQDNTAAAKMDAIYPNK
ncbi:hypothetical protein [Actinocrispum wychmicini]|uniref:Excreted virulence factor EspC (Type VII ESX diderm) n=1 Tax=Actinocrispum wychmicini TaxID=1213861 RepID=A0A4R2IZF5_9PSEU|nr:hypothetical protein [Actinocrispum wychmicini]TCO50717.1 hypothetical protein EV192_11395 [Actinocrispum wychmicini]